MTITATSSEIGPWVVLNCSVTQVLGHYPTEAAAKTAADGFGNASFAYELSAAESAAMAVI